LQIDIDKISKAYIVNNSPFLTEFERFRKSEAVRQQIAPLHHARQHWKDVKNVKLVKDLPRRLAFYDHLEGYISMFDWNEPIHEEKHLSVIPMIQCVSESEAQNICQTGFKIQDHPKPLFGKGIYFSSSLPHAQAIYYKGAMTKSSSSKLKDGKDRGREREKEKKKMNEMVETSVFLVALVAPGNPYPVVEDPQQASLEVSSHHERSLENQHILNGYQSHYTIVDSERNVSTQSKVPQFPEDELIVSSESQTFPLFLVYYTN